MTFSGKFLFLFFISAVAEDTYPCNKTQAIEAFKQKILLNPFPPFKNDPYQNQTIESLQLIEATLQNSDIVCALKYTDASKRRFYDLQQFADAATAQTAGYIVTHQGRCGTCSSLQDLAVYLERPDLTSPVRKCAILTLVSNELAFYCIKKLGKILRFRLF